MTIYVSGNSVDTQVYKLWKDYQKEQAKEQGVDIKEFKPIEGIDLTYQQLKSQLKQSTRLGLQVYSNFVYNSKEFELYFN